MDVRILKVGGGVEKKGPFVVNIVVIFFIIIARSERTPEGQENSYKLCRQQRVNRAGSQPVVPVRRSGAEVVLPTCIPLSTGGGSKGE